MNTKKPTPVLVSAASKACPVCGQRSYSRGGIHPQCAVVQADAPRRICLAAAKKAAAQEKDKAIPAKSGEWGKSCPQCGIELPARRNVCACGHIFGGN